MYGDFSRDTFLLDKHLTRVLMQQGRVLLDADWNEQTAILLHYLRSLAADLIGRHGGPGDGFTLVANREGDLVINPGHYYVDGLLCENDRALDDAGRPIDVTYLHQPDYKPADALPTDKPLLVYLDVWERASSAVEDPALREVALGGPDTAARARLVWQVKIADAMPDGKPLPSDEAQIRQIDADDSWPQWAALWQPTSRGLLKAKCREDIRATDPCITSPDARYRGAENQLYRVEIHTGGTAPRAGTAGRTATGGRATFKWSRDNGAVIFPIRALDGTSLTLDSLGRDDRLRLREGQWVEILDDDIVRRGGPGQLLEVASVQPLDGMVTLKAPAAQGYDEQSTSHPFARRWDHHAGERNRGGLTIAGDGAALLTESADGRVWLALEDGVQIQFQPAAKGQQQQYRSGDYWLIPARTATGGIEWPGAPDDPRALPPHGVEHHYAPLAVIVPQPGNPDTPFAPTALRRGWQPLAVRP